MKRLYNIQHPAKHVKHLDFRVKGQGFRSQLDGGDARGGVRIEDEVRGAVFGDTDYGI